MATDKVYKVFGVSKLSGSYKVRFANDVMRIKVLAKHGHEDITLTELDTPVTKYAGILAIQGMSEFASVHAQAAIQEYLDEKAPKGVAKAAPVKAPATAKKAAPKATAPKAVKVTEDEDAPFA
jgi:hypothetical protein